MPSLRHLGCVRCRGVHVCPPSSCFGSQLAFFVGTCHGGCLLRVGSGLQGDLELLLLIGLGAHCLFQARNILFLVLDQLLVVHQHLLNVVHS